jgi:hypothetical protein
MVSQPRRLCFTYRLQQDARKRKEEIRGIKKILLKNLLVSKIICTLAPSKHGNNMSYTKEPIVITNPSKELLEAIKKMRERKQSKLEELRNMKPEDFSCRIIL